MKQNNKANIFEVYLTVTLGANSLTKLLKSLKTFLISTKKLNQLKQQSTTQAPGDCESS